MLRPGVAAWTLALAALASPQMVASMKLAQFKMHGTFSKYLELASEQGVLQLQDLADCIQDCDP